MSTTLKGKPRHHLHVLPFLKRPAQRFILAEWTALTIGSHVFAWRRLDEPELAHELTHVTQWQRHGVMFPFRYFMASRRAGIFGDRYRDNEFEVEAFSVEAGVRAQGTGATD